MPLKQPLQIPEQHVPEPAVRRLTSLFEEARFSVHPVDEAMMSDPPRPKTVVLLRTMLGQDPNVPLPKFAPDPAQ